MDITRTGTPAARARATGGRASGAGGGWRIRAEAWASLLPTAAAVLVIVAAGLLAERLLGALAHAHSRARVQAEADAFAARLDGALAAQLRGLALIEGVLLGAGLPDAAGFARLAAPHLADPSLRAVAAHAPDGRARVSPARGALGAELAALAAAPPAGLVARLAPGPGSPTLLVAAGGAGGGPRTAAALDLHALSGLATATATADDPGRRIDIALVAGPASAPRLLLGDARALNGAPVTRDLAFPAAELRLAAAPRGGWTAGFPGRWPIRLVTALAALLIAGPMLRTRRLVAERQRHIADLNDREAELARLSRRLGLALEASQVGVWDFDLAGGALVWDSRMNDLYGLPGDGRPRRYADWRGRLHPDDLARAEAEFRDAIEGDGRYASDYRLALPCGGARHIRAIGAVFAAPDGSRRIVGVNWDVTADVEGRAELDAKRREAEAASVAKSQFLATMSHEIRTPMSGVLGMLDLMLRDELGAAQRDRAGIARDSARHLLAILNDILEFSRLEAQSVALDPVPVNPRALLGDVAALLCAAAAERGVALGTTVDPATPDWLTCDPTRLRQVLLNLVGNALKFTDAGRVDVALTWRPDGGGALEVAVRDTGIGIPEADRARLFQRFVQVDGSAARRRGGAGLGLAISRQLVELMGGGIGLDSAPGPGSTFRFWTPAPACAAPDAPDAPREPAGLAPAPAPLRILLAEDNATNQKILSAYLTRAGHSVRLAANGHETLDALARGPFDLVLMDIQMPGMDGIAATRRIRALPGPLAAIPIIALTANAMVGDREAYLAAGMTTYLSKPVAPEALHAAIARVAPPPAARCA